MSADVIYYNLTLQTENPSNSGDVNVTPANPIFREADITISSNIPILHNPSEYYGSVVRLAIPGEAIPLTQFLIQAPYSGGAYNNSVYSFTMTYGSTIGQEFFVQYETENLDSGQPPPDAAAQQQFGPYYFVYTYQHLCNLFNKTLVQALANIKTLVGGAISGAKDPFFYYNPVTERLELYADGYFDRSNPIAAEPITLWFSQPCYVFFPQMCYISVSLDNARYSFFDIRNYGPNVTWLPQTPPGGSVPPGQTQYIIISQELVSTAYMSPLRSIIVTTNMNIRPETFNLAIPHNEQSGVQNTGYANVLTDFLPDISQPNAGITSYKFIYNADSLYRLFEFYQRTPLYSMNASIFWTDTLGNQYPLQLSKGQTGSLKFMFVKKDSPVPKMFL